jgi:CRISP-associated protein Cas1
MTSPDLIPVRILNEFVYCPRLAYMEWVQSEFVHNAHTLEGKLQHARVDKPETRSDNSGDQEILHHQSLKLSSESAGLITVMDIVREQDKIVAPIEYKHGSAPDIQEGAYENDRVQLCAQGLVLRDNGYTCDQGHIFFWGSRKKIVIPFDQPLIDRTLEVIRQVRDMAVSGDIPPPLHNSPKCPQCSLVTICLPDETIRMNAAETSDQTIRPLVPPCRDSKPVYVSTQGARVTKSQNGIAVVSKDGGDVRARFMDVSHLAVFGSVQVTTPLVQALCNARIPIVYFSQGGWFYGMTTGIGNRNAELRLQQFRVLDNPEKRLEIARSLINAKIRNSRTLLRRNSKAKLTRELRQLNYYATQALKVTSTDKLLGIEGNAARIYFKCFPQMIQPSAADSREMFSFENRNRRPPRDPVNALLSFAYSILTKDFVIALMTVGFDPYSGFYHGMKYGRPALALDMMEMFRPLVADSVVINVINNGIIQPNDFVSAIGSVNLTAAGRKKFLQAYERRVDTLVTHPVFGYRVSYRQIFEIQSRLLSRYLAGEFDTVPVFLTR